MLVLPGNENTKMIMGFGRWGLSKGRCDDEQSSRGWAGAFTGECKSFELTGQEVIDSLGFFFGRGHHTFFCKGPE